MKLLLQVIIAVIAGLSLHGAVRKALDAKVEVATPSAQTVTLYYNTTERVLRAMGEGMEP
jgi:hypothetical protein